MRLVVVGSRNYTDRAFVFQVLDMYKINTVEIDTIVSGGAAGPDTFAAEWADENGIQKHIILADWQTHGKSAGFIRNSDLWDNADEGVAFWDGKSKGTEHSFGLAKRQKKTLLVFSNRELVKYIRYGIEVELDVLDRG